MPPEAFSRPVPLQDVTSAVVYGLQREVVGVAIGEQDEARRGAVDSQMGKRRSTQSRDTSAFGMGRGQHTGDTHWSTQTHEQG
jgi:hypothetical protein